MSWYSGPTLMHHLEHVHVASDRDLVDVRFPVQYVVRPKSDEHHDYRGYGGQVAGGVLKPGDEVVVLPSGMTSTIAGHRPVRPGARRGVPADVGDRPARGRRRRVPRRHDRPGQERAAAEPGHRRDGLLDDQHAAEARARSWRSSTPPAPRGRWSRTSSTASTSTRCTATRTPRSSASTRSAASSCAPPCRCCATRTPRTAPPARSS